MRKGSAVEHTLKMHIISSCIILFMMILNIFCKGKENKNWNIIFTPAEVTAVPGLCVVIPCTFTYPNETKPKNLQLYQCKEGNKCDIEIEKAKLKKFELDKNKCNIIINNISAEDKGEYEIRENGSQSHINSPRFKINIQDKPVISNHSLREGEEASLSCSAPVACTKTPPDITFWIKKNKSIKLKKITSATSKGFIVTTLTFIPTAELHNATVECKARYGNISINTSTNIEVKLNNSKTNKTDTPKDGDPAKNRNLPGKDTESQNATGNNTGVNNENQVNRIEDFFKNLGLSTVHTFLVGIATSAVFFSVVLCCWVSCNRTKKAEVLAAPPDSAVHLETVQTNIDSAVNGEQTNEETPLQNQFDVEMSSTLEVTGPAEESEAGGADVGDVDYAAIDYSFLKKKPPEEEEEKTANTDYAEIKRDKKGRKAHQNQDDQVEMSNKVSENQKQNEGEEELYSNSQALKKLK